jgi:catechol 2,3-dioxygenase-like lactoylglutathione lyase family enzyme
MLGFNKIVAFVPTHDSHRARSFYEDVLGLTFVSEDHFALIMDMNGTMLRIVKVKAHTPAPFTILGWEVEGIENTASALRQKGVTFERFSGLSQDELGIWTAPGGDKVAWFKDPDGNVLSLSQHVKH